MPAFAQTNKRKTRHLVMTRHRLNLAVLIVLGHIFGDISRLFRDLTVSLVHFELCLE